MRFSNWMKLGVAVLFSSSLMGCGMAVDIAEDLLEDDVESREGLEATTDAGVRMCENAVDSLIRQNGSWSNCDAALVTDCAEVVGLFQDSYIDDVAACLEGDLPPAVCFFQATLDLTPTKAHDELVDSYCNRCLFGVDGCEEVMSFGDEGQLGLGMVALPFNDHVVREIEDECTTDLMCSVELPKCAEEVVLMRLIPEATLGCLLDPLSE